VGRGNLRRDYSSKSTSWDGSSPGKALRTDLDILQVGLIIRQYQYASGNLAGKE